MKLGQSKVMSFVEAILNIFTGMVTAFTISQLASHNEALIQQYIYSDFHWQISIQSNICMTIVLTTASVIRHVVWRRVFNKIHEKDIKHKLNMRSERDGALPVAKTKKR